MQSSEAELVRAAQRGDRPAFGLLYEQYARMIHGILLSHVAFSDADDLVHDVFLRAMQQLNTLRDPRAFGGWLVTIARRAATDLHRKRRFTWLSRETPAVGRSADKSFAILAEVKKLPDAYRETLILRLVEGMTGPEIASRTGMTPDSVRVNLCRGMKLLRTALEGNI